MSVLRRLASAQYWRPRDTIPVSQSKPFNAINGAAGGWPGLGWLAGVRQLRNRRLATAGIYQKWPESGWRQWPQWPSARRQLQLACVAESSTQRKHQMLSKKISIQCSIFIQQIISVAYQWHSESCRLISSALQLQWPLKIQCNVGCQPSAKYS